MIEKYNNKELVISEKKNKWNANSTMNGSMFNSMMVTSTTPFLKT